MKSPVVELGDLRHEQKHTQRNEYKEQYHPAAPAYRWNDGL